VELSDYPKSLIVIVVCPLNALIECHMKELKRRGISCTCLSRGDSDKGGALAGEYTLSSLQISRRLSSMTI